MLRLIGIIISIAAADAVNPSTLVPALIIASGERPFWEVLRFGAGVLTTTVTGGLILLLGPGELILDLVPKPSPTEVDWLQTAAGVVLLLAAAIVWHRRTQIARRAEAKRRDRDSSQTTRRPAFLLGAGIAAAGLPANVAYLGAIATIIDSDQGVGGRLLLLAIYDAVFILPMAAIIAILGLLPHRSARLLGALRRLLQDHTITALLVVLPLAGLIVLALGISGLASR